MVCRSGLSGQSQKMLGPTLWTVSSAVRLSPYEGPLSVHCPSCGNGVHLDVLIDPDLESALHAS
jgi:hypothetical protein